MPDRKTIVTVLTPPGRAALALIVVTGSGAEQLVGRYFQPVSKSALGFNRMRFGRWQSPQGEEIIVCRRRDRMEIHCHGGAVASAAIVEDLVSGGATRGDWREWIRERHASALLTEAHEALVMATTERAARCLLDQYLGALASAVTDVRRLLGGGQLQAAHCGLRALKQSARLGLHLTTPWRVVITGPPNVGKSSLMNALVGYPRAIVHSQAGTTRDLLTATTAIDGWPMELIDTAGVRNAVDAIEQEGVQLAMAAGQTADLILAVTDVTQPPVDVWPQFGLEPYLVKVGNKSDLLEQVWHASGAATRREGYPADLLVSARTGAGLDDLFQRISRQLVPEPPPAGQPVVFTQRQLRIVEASIQALEAASVDAALFELRRMDLREDLESAAKGIA